MFGKRVTLFRLSGFEVRVDLSWFLLGLLIAWSLAEGLFPYYVGGLSTAQYWSMAVVGVAGLLLSVVLHELAHSVVARRFGMPIDGITLFLFGGVAEMDDEPPTPRAEFFMAAAGPLLSALLAGLFFALYGQGLFGLAPAVAGIVIYLALLNLLLAAFNVVPAFPLDGGRVLRALLWGWSGDLRWATRIAAGIGAGFGWILVAAGAWFLLQGALVSGLWWVLIGLFLRATARGAYRQIVLKERLDGVAVAALMDRFPVRVPADTPITYLVNRYARGYHHAIFPVVEGDRLVGCIDATLPKRIPRGEWDRHSVREFTGGCPVEHTLGPDADARHALAAMARRGQSLLMIVDGGALRGTLTMSDLVYRIAAEPPSERHWRA